MAPPPDPGSTWLVHHDVPQSGQADLIITGLEAEQRVNMRPTVDYMAPVARWLQVLVSDFLALVRVRVTGVRVRVVRVSTHRTFLFLVIEIFFFFLLLFLLASYPPPPLPQMRSRQQLGSSPHPPGTRSGSHTLNSLPGANLAHPASLVCSHAVGVYQARTAINALAFVPEGCRMVLGCQNGQLRTVHCSELKEVHSIQAHTSPTTAVQWMHNGFWLASADRDGTLVLSRPEPVRDLSLIYYGILFQQNFGSRPPSS